MQIPELPAFSKQGAEFIQSLTDRVYPEALARIGRTAIGREYPLVQKGAEFFSQLVDGRFSRSMQEFRHGLDALLKMPALQDLKGKIGEWQKEYRQSATMEDRARTLEKGQRIASEFTDGLIRQRVEDIAKDAARFASDPRSTEIIHSIVTGNDLMMAFRRGNFVQVLSTINQRMAGSPAIQQIIQQALHLTTTGANFFAGLMSRDWERPLNQLLRKSPGNKDVQVATSVFFDALNLFWPLEKVDNMSPFIQYQKQLDFLRDQESRERLIQHYEGRFRF